MVFIERNNTTTTDSDANGCVNLLLIRPLALIHSLWASFVHADGNGRSSVTRGPHLEVCAVR